MSSCIHNQDFECFWCADERHALEHPESVSGCVTCKFRSIQISPAATPNRTQARRAAHPPRTPNNSWEKGIATDERGMPLLGKDAEPIGVKQYAEQRRPIEERRRQLRNDPHALRS